MQNCLPSSFSRDFVMVKAGKGFSQNLKLLCSSRVESPAFLQNNLPVHERENIYELGLPASPRSRDSLLAEDREKRLFRVVPCR